MSEENNGTQPQGKQMGIAGFVLALVTLVLSNWIAALSVAAIITGGSGWLMYVWLVLAIVSVILSGMAMSKLGKTGGKKGLAVAGLVIGIVSVVWSAILVAGLSIAASATTDLGGEWQDAMDQLEQSIEDAENE